MILAAVMLAAIIRPEICEPSFPARNFSVTDYGARPDGSDATVAFGRAINACAAAGGGRVIVPTGTYVTGPIHLKSNVDFHLEEETVLDFVDDPKAYLPAVPSSWEGLECWNYSPLVYAYGCTNVALTGRGLLRPRMAKWKEIMEEPKTDIASARALLYKWGGEDYPVEKRIMPEACAAVMRPQLIQFNRSKDVLIEGVRIKESPFWTIHLFLCDGVTVRNVEVDAHGFNNDGIDIEMTRNVLVDGGVFNAGDDGFVFKAGRNRDGWRIGVPTENVLVRNAHVKFAHSLLCVGSEMSAGVRNVVVENCRVDDCWKLLYVKTNARRGGFVEDIILRDVKANKVEDVLRVNTDVLYQWRNLPTYEERITKISNLKLENVEVGFAGNVVSLSGDGRNPIDGVTFENVSVRHAAMDPISLHSARNVDLTGLRIGSICSPRTDAFSVGERVAFVGDSITHGGGYVAYLQLFQSLRHPGSGTRIMNVGISGGDAGGGVARLESDILVQKPDRAFVMFGMNDVGRHLYAAPVPRDEAEAKDRALHLFWYRDSICRLVDRLWAAGVETVLMTPTPYDQYGEQTERNMLGCNEPGLSDCAGIVREIATQRRMSFVDLHAPLTRALKDFPRACFCRDRVHPSPAGHLLVAAQVLESLCMTSVVADIEIDAKTVKAISACNAGIGGIRNCDGGLEFSYSPKSLPFPRWNAYDKVEKVYPLTERLNREMLYVRNLPDGMYDMLFDNVKIASFSADELNAGINLALLDTPNQRRARSIVSVVERLKDVVERRRYLVLIRLRLRKAGIKLEDTEAAFTWLDKWQNGKGAPACYRNWADNYRKWSLREDELVSDEESARATLDGVRPITSRVRLRRNR